MLHVRAIELWRPVVGFEGEYEVSNCGLVRSVDRVQVRPSDGKSFRRRGQLLKPAPHPKGHLVLHLTRGQARYVHDLVLCAFIGPRPDGMIALHADDNPANNRASNLRWGSYSDNARDAVRNGTHHQAVKTVCPRGHRLVAPNLVVSVLPRRGCKSCNRAYAATSGKVRTPEILQRLSDAQYERIMTGA